MSSKWYTDPIDSLDDDTVEMLITEAEARDIFGDAVSYPHDCRHEWKTYTGAREVFDFCIKCDTKR